MTEQDVREVLGRALGDQPTAMTITRESAVAAGRRARRRRRMRSQTAVVAGVVAAVVLAMVVPWRLAGGPVGAAGSVGTTPPPTPSIQAPPVRSPTAQPVAKYPRMYPSAQTIGLSQRLRTAAVRMLPDAYFGSVPIGFDNGTYELAPFDVVDNQHGYFIGVADIYNGSSAGLFDFLLWPHADDRKSPKPACDSAYTPRLSCEQTTGPNGEQITVETGRMAGGTATEYRVKVHRADGVILMATVTDAVLDQDGYQATPPAPYLGVPLTTDQLIELLLTPGLNLATPTASTSSASPS